MPYINIILKEKATRIQLPCLTLYKLTRSYILKVINIKGLYKDKVPSGKVFRLLINIFWKDFISPSYIISYPLDPNLQLYYINITLVPIYYLLRISFLLVCLYYPAWIIQLTRGIKYINLSFIYKVTLLLYDFKLSPPLLRAYLYSWLALAFILARLVYRAKTSSLFPLIFQITSLKYSPSVNKYSYLLKLLSPLTYLTLI